MSMKSLQQAVKKSQKDEFEEGTVIRWIASGKYMYGAMKTSVGWYTTATSHNNGSVPQVLTFDRLLEIIGKAETTQVAVATQWMEIN